MQAKFGSAQRLRRLHIRSCGAVMAANGAADSARGGRAVLWFRNDLRIHDNAIVAEAARRAKAGQIKEVCSCRGTIGDPCCRVLLFDARRPPLLRTQQHNPQYALRLDPLQVVPVYCFDPRQFIETPWGHSKCGPYGAQFRLESVRPAPVPICVSCPELCAGDTASLRSRTCFAPPAYSLL